MKIKERVKELHAENYFISVLIVVNLLTLIEVTIVDPTVEILFLTKIAITWVILIAVSGMSLGIKKYKIKTPIKIAIYLILLLLFVFMKLTPPWLSYPK